MKYNGYEIDTVRLDNNLALHVVADPSVSGFHYVCTAIIINPLKEYGALNLVIYKPILTPNLVLRLMLRTQKSPPRERPESRRFG
jgi:hypothetical protein